MIRDLRHWDGKRLDVASWLQLKKYEVDVNYKRKRICRSSEEKNVLQ